MLTCAATKTKLSGRIRARVQNFKEIDALPQVQALVSISTESPSMDEVVKALSKLDNLEQVYEVTGEFDIVALVSAPDLDGFRDTLTREIMKIKGVKSTTSSIVLDEHKINRGARRRKKSARRSHR